MTRWEHIKWWLRISGWGVFTGFALLLVASDIWWPDSFSLFPWWVHVIGVIIYGVCLVLTIKDYRQALNVYRWLDGRDRIVGVLALRRWFRRAD